MDDIDSERMILSFAERWMLANQYEILKRLDGEGQAFYEQAVEILSIMATASDARNLW